MLSVPSKGYAKILDSWLRSRTENMVMEVQGGFKSGRSCVNQMFGALFSEIGTINVYIYVYNNNKLIQTPKLRLGHFHYA